jgi:S1-C subfamily serine protease
MKPSRPALFLFTLLLAASCYGQTVPKPVSKRTDGPKTSQSSLTSLPYGQARLVTVAVVKKTGHDRQKLGSAVWVGNSGYLVTCEHVIRGITEPLLVEIAYDPLIGTAGKMSVTLNDIRRAIAAKVVASDRDSDTAILLAASKPSEVHGGRLTSGVAVETPQSPMAAKGAMLETDYPRPGDALLLSGYPLVEVYMHVMQAGIATGLGFPTDNHSATGLRIILSLVSNPGNSGGPVLDTNGKVVALLEGNLTTPIRDQDGRQMVACWRARLDPSGNPTRDPAGNPIPELTPCMENTGISFAVPAKYVVELAKKNNIDLR